MPRRRLGLPHGDHFHAVAGPLLPSLLRGQRIWLLPRQHASVHPLLEASQLTAREHVFLVAFTQPVFAWLVRCMLAPRIFGPPRVPREKLEQATM